MTISLKLDPSLECFYLIMVIFILSSELSLDFLIFSDNCQEVVSLWLSKALDSKLAKPNVVKNPGIGHKKKKDS